MFGKIKDKLKNIFEKSEEVIEENPDEVIEVPVEKLDKTEKKGFLSKIFGKKEEIEVDDEEVINEPEEIEPSKSIVKKENKKSPKKESKTKETTKKNKEKNLPKQKTQEKKKTVKVNTEIESEEYEEPIEELDSISEISEPELVEEESIEQEKPKEEKKGFFGKLFSKKKEEEIVDEEESKPELIVEKKREIQEETGFLAKLKSKKITEDDFDKIWVELEIFLLEINIAYEIVEKIESKLKEELIGNSFNRFKLTEKIQHVMSNEVENVLSDREANFLEKLNEIKSNETPVKILVLGVNGTGKTTTIAKIVHYLQSHSLSVVVAAADTFRAAAVEQLEEHSKKLNFKLIQHKGGSDPAAVAFDAIEHAKARKIDVVLIDTAGRMPNNANLMMELQKVKRVSNAQMAIFIGDSISGNDLIDQIELFNQGVEIDGVILTKVDTDEKPGSIVTTAYSVEKPIYFLGVGQTYDDLVEFNAKEISQKLFNADDEEE